MAIAVFCNAFLDICDLRLSSHRKRNTVIGFGDRSRVSREPVNLRPLSSD